MVTRRNFYLEIFLIGFAALLLEVSYTRFISYKLFYYHTYLVIGLGLLGIGSGAVLVTIFPQLGRITVARMLAAGCWLASLTVALGYFVIALIPLSVLDFWSDPAELPRLFAVCLAMFLPFLMVGLMIAALFGHRSESINALYFADLAGAGAGCAAAVPLMGVVSPPVCILLSSLVFAVTGAHVASIGSPRAFRLNSVTAAVVAIIALLTPVLPDVVPDKLKTMNPEALREGDVLYSEWSPVFRVDVTKSLRPDDAVRVIHHDGIWGSTLQRYEGDPASLKHFDKDERAFPFKVAPSEPEDVIIIGSAGGHEILAALHFEAKSITAVELNPVTVSLLTEEFSDYTGRLNEDPRVHMVVDEGRSFLARARQEYDLIYFVAPDSYATMNAATSAAFVLTESYLYTKEMIVESLAHLKDDGVIAIQFGEDDFETKPNRTLRYLATARSAFAEAGIEDFDKHVMVATTEGLLNVATILLSKNPFTAGQILSFIATAGKVPDSRARHVAGSKPGADAISAVVSLDDEALSDWHSEYAFDVRPVTDDAPFFWHFTPFSSVLAGLGGRLDTASREEGAGERVLLVLLAVAVVFAAVFLLLPFAAVHSIWAKLPHKGRTALYFSMLGLGFMFFEICLIQKLTLFLGYPTRSLTVTLASMLVFTGIGSMLSAAYQGHRNGALAVLLTVTGLVTVAYLFALDDVTASYMGTDILTRIYVTVAIIAPLGLALGGFLPLGLATVASLSDYRSEYIAWAWAVNGFFSVIGSVLTTILSMVFGFTAVLILGLTAYVIAVASLRRIPIASS